MAVNMEDHDEISEMKDSGEEFVSAPDELDMSDDEANDHSHTKLLHAMSSLGGTKKAQPRQRTEVAPVASEFHLTSESGTVKLNELVRALRRTSSHGKLQKQISKLDNQKEVLKTPLPKFKADEIERKVAHEKTTKEVSKWEPIVLQNRKADHLEFPLERPDVRLRTMDKVTRGLKARSPMEMEIEKLLRGNANDLSNKEEFTEAEKEALQAMSIEEAHERRAELQKHRALISFKAAKAHRQNKIKSKRYHRVLRKEKLKAEKKAMEELKHKDPSAYADELMRMHQDHIKERMSLKHRGGSKFMARQKIFGKFDDKSRQAVADMIEKSKELKQKVSLESSSDEEEMVEEDEKESVNESSTVPTGSSETFSSNPWMKTVSLKRAFAQAKYSKPEAVHAENNSDEDGDEGEEVEDSQETSDDENLTELEEKRVLDSEDEAPKPIDSQPVSEQIEDIFSVVEKTVVNEKTATPIKENRKVGNQNSNSKQVKKTKKQSESESESDSEGDDDKEDTTKKSEKEDVVGNKPRSEKGLSMSLKRKQTLEDFEGDSSDEDSGPSVSSAHVEPTELSKPSSSSYDLQVDPNKFVTVETRIRSKMAPDLITDGGDAAEDVEAQQRLTIAQAFAADDVVEEFEAEKRKIEERDKPKDIDLTLPGWGTWGGTGLKVPKWKQKRFVIKAPPAPPRKDRALNKVIISESKDKSIAKHQVQELPFPFSNVDQFESSVRAPVGKMWNPETVFKTLIEPRITTRIGSIIDPIDKAHAFKNEQTKPKRLHKKQGKGPGGKEHGGNRAKKAKR